MGKPKVRKPLTRRQVLWRLSLAVLTFLTIFVTCYGTAPWSWGLFFTSAAIVFGLYASWKRGWIAHDSIVPGVVLACSATPLQRLFYGPMPHDWAPGFFMTGVFLAGAVVGIACAWWLVPESDRVRDLRAAPQS